MNIAEIVAQVSKKTGIPADICQKVVAAFEGQSADALLGRLKGVKLDAGVIAGIAGKTGVKQEDCERILGAVEGAIGGGLADKLKSFF